MFSETRVVEMVSFRWSSGKFKCFPWVGRAFPNCENMLLQLKKYINDGPQSNAIFIDDVGVFTSRSLWPKTYPLS